MNSGINYVDMSNGNNFTLKELETALKQNFENSSPQLKALVQEGINKCSDEVEKIIYNAIDTTIKPILKGIINNKENYSGDNLLVKVGEVNMQLHNLLRYMENEGYDIKDNALYNNLHQFYLNSLEQIKSKDTLNSPNLWVAAIKENYEKYLPVTNQKSVQNNVEIVK